MGVALNRRACSCATICTVRAWDRLLQSSVRWIKLTTSQRKLFFGDAMRTLSTQRRAALVLALVAFAACDGHAPNATTSFSVMLKDAPGDVQHAVVTISEVDL